MTASKVRCDVEWYASEPQHISFIPGEDLSVHVADDGPLGAGLSPVTADLVELGASIFFIERQLKRRRQPPTKLELTFPVRDPAPWSNAARNALADTLQFLGNARWSIEVVNRRGNRALPAHERKATGATEAIVLFSGGLDSACGAATSRSGTTQLVSYYSRQRRRQASMAETLGHRLPVQWRIARNPDKSKRTPEPGRSFRYRSFFFLALGAVTASAFGANRLVQFENGVLASAIPPSEAWLMTKHAHPRLQELAGRFFSALLGNTYTVENPFWSLTKRQCFQEAAALVGSGAFAKVARQTDSCWHLWSNRIPGASKYVPGKKSPGRHCGVCIPCLVRRTAVQDNRYARDMRRPTWQNHDRFGRDFRAYYGFLDGVRGTRSVADFYRVLPAPGRHLFADPSVSPEELFNLFHTFADEFWDTFVD